MIVTRTLLVGLLFYLGGALTLNAQAPTEWEALIAGADIGDMMVMSGQGKIQFDYVRVDSLSVYAKEKDQEHISQVGPDVEVVIRNNEKVNIDYAFDGVKVRFIESSLNLLPTGRLYTQNWRWAYNGEKLDLLCFDGLGENGLIIPRGSIRADYVPRIKRFDPRFNGLKVIGTPVGKFLRGKLGDNVLEKMQIVKEEEINGYLCKVINAHVVNSSDSITVWLAQSIMYRPLQIEYVSTDEVIKVQTNFKEYNGGILFPKTVQKEEYYIERSTGKRVLYNLELITVMDDFAVNVEIPYSFFEIEFPTGLWVYDYRLGEKIESK